MNVSIRPKQRPKEQLFCSFCEIGCPLPTLVHPTDRALHVFKQFVWLKVDSVKTASSRPTHQRVTPIVGRNPSGMNQ